MSNLSKKSFAQPDELKTPPKTNAAVVKLGNISASKLTLEPGWKWSECVSQRLVGIAAKRAMLVSSFKEH